MEMKIQGGKNEMSHSLQRVVKAFLVGAAAGLTGQILLMFLSLAIPDPAMAGMASAVVFGLISLGLILSGLYFPIGKFGNDGASIPLSGLMFGAAILSAAARKAGATEKRAFLYGFFNVMKMIGIGYISAFILGLLLR